VELDVKREADGRSGEIPGGPSGDANRRDHGERLELTLDEHGGLVCTGIVDAVFEDHAPELAH
jgi:hypothetical protein